VAYKLRILSLAKSDAKEIKSWLSQFYPSTPGKFFVKLKEGFNNLKDNPFMYEEYRDYPAYRKMTVSDYQVFYKVIKTKKIVEIHRILHGARNIREVLKKESDR
jgi:addiction module RelE/StbE family toxin